MKLLLSIHPKTEVMLLMTHYVQMINVVVYLQDLIELLQQYISRIRQCQLTRLEVITICAARLLLPGTVHHGEGALSRGVPVLYITGGGALSGGYQYCTLQGRGSERGVPGTVHHRGSERGYQVLYITGRGLWAGVPGTVHHRGSERGYQVLYITGGGDGTRYCTSQGGSSCTNDLNYPRLMIY